MRALIRSRTTSGGVFVVAGKSSRPYSSGYTQRDDSFVGSRANDDEHDAALPTRAPRAVGDFELQGTPDEVVPGAHPLPLNNSNITTTGWPLVSPYMPSPHRSHPYWTEPPAELPHLPPSVPPVWTLKCIREDIVVPVFSTESGTVTHTRQLDPYVFGQYPQTSVLSDQAYYWVVRHQNYKAHNELGKLEIFRKSKKNWPNTGMGMTRVSARKMKEYPWGGRNQPNKPWFAVLPTADPTTWHTACRMTLALKLLQGKVQVVDRLALPEATPAAFAALCDKMQWDVRQTGAGVLFMDGGSRLAPSLQFERSFFYGSFHNGKIKVVRPTITVDEPYDWDRSRQLRREYEGPAGHKNPVPINRFNIYDALEHHLLVLTEGAVVQLEQEMETIKAAALPPHIREQMAQFGMLDHHLLGTTPARLEAMEREVAGRVEEREMAMYEPYYDNPYKPWADEAAASYEVDATRGYIKRHVDGQAGSWRKIQ